MLMRLDDVIGDRSNKKKTGHNNKKPAVFLRRRWYTVGNKLSASTFQLNAKTFRNHIMSLLCLGSLQFGYYGVARESTAVSDETPKQAIK